MSGDVSLSKLIEVLKRDWSVINPARMQDILDRLLITTEDVRPHSLFSEKRYARNLVYKDREFEIMIMCWNSGHVPPFMTMPAHWGD
jgi:hypothetical protein